MPNKPFALAFKVAAEAAKHEALVGRLFSLEIANITGGKYSHVVAAFSLPDDLKLCLCFSSNEPHGTGLQALDLSDQSLWTIMEIPTTDLQWNLAYGYAVGATPRLYNAVGIIGIATSAPITDPYSRFCSQTCCEMVQLSHSLFDGINPAKVAPSGFAGDPNRHGLFEMLTAALKSQAVSA